MPNVAVNKDGYEKSKERRAEQYSLNKYGRGPIETTDKNPICENCAMPSKLHTRLQRKECDSR